MRLQTGLSVEEGSLKGGADTCHVLIDHLGKGSRVLQVVEHLHLIVDVQAHCLSQLLQLVHELTGHTLASQVVVQGHVQHHTHVQGAVHSIFLVLAVLLIELLRDLQPPALYLDPLYDDLTVFQILNYLLPPEVIELLLELFSVLVLEDTSDLLVLGLRQVEHVLGLVRLHFELQAVQLVLDVRAQRGQVFTRLLVRVDDRHTGERGLDRLVFLVTDFSADFDRGLHTLDHFFNAFIDQGVGVVGDRKEVDGFSVVALILRVDTILHVLVNVLT